MALKENIWTFPKVEGNYRLSHKLENFKVKLYDFALDDDLNWQQTEVAETIEKTIQPYLPSDRAREAIELAQMLERPILLQGEPGSGKTKLAQALAIDWYGERYRSKYFEWHIKSTAKAIDGLYTFDHIARLRDAQPHAQPTSGSAGEDLNKYLHLGPLGQAFMASTEEEPAILLIDEIDKADIDFPNDLLLEIDESRFWIREASLEKMYQAKGTPLIFITSNKEKKLSPAFIRRCLYLYFTFPEEQTLKDIMQARYPNLKANDTLQNALIERFKALRKRIEETPNINRLPSTSEFLDWAQAVEYEIKKRALTPEDLDEKKLRLRFAPALLKDIEELKLEKLFE